MTSTIRIIMLGTGDFALPTFEHLIETGHDVVALVTQPDRPQGRKQELIPSLIKRSAQSRGIAVDQPDDVNAPEALERVRELKPDLLVTAAYGQILSPTLLSIPRLGGINLHGSILPGVSRRGPGRPRHSERRNGDRRHGHPDDPPDRRRRHRLDRPHRRSDRTKRPASWRTAWPSLVLRSLPKPSPLSRPGSITILPQDRSKVTKAPKLRKEDGLIDWQKPAQAIHDLVRAMQPWPVAQTTWQPGSSAPTEPAG